VAVVQVAERTGQGVDRVYREMLRSGKEPPEFNDLGTLVRVLLPGGVGNDSFVRFVNVLPDGLAGDVEVLLAFSWLRHHRTVDASQLAGSIQRSVSEAQRVLGSLADGGYLEPSRRTAARTTPTYRLRSEAIAAMSLAVTYGHRGADDIDQKVIDHIREYGFVTNRTIQRLFDISVYAARNMLAEMRGRGLLEKIGEARGGPGVRYGPGPAFPA
jgi:ATP-dependent DNA helicase RecG